jgi:hypothetical protein
MPTSSLSWTSGWSRMLKDESVTRLECSNLSFQVSLWFDGFGIGLVLSIGDRTVIGCPPPSSQQQLRSARRICRAKSKALFGSAASLLSRWPPHCSQSGWSRKNRRNALSTLVLEQLSGSCISKCKSLGTRSPRRSRTHTLPTCSVWDET